MPLVSARAAAVRVRRSAAVVRTAAAVYLGYKRTQRRVARLPEPERAAVWGEQHARSAARIVATARRLRGLYTKSAQFLGARADLLPEEYIAALSQLHDRAPAQPYTRMLPILRDGLGDDPARVFAAFDPLPIAAASLAQVHRARLHDGRQVAVKVQYPDIARLVELDMRNLATVLRLVHRAERSLDLEPIARAVARLVPQELDFAHEGRSSERIGAALRARGDIVVPAVVWEHSSARVLVTEYVEGTKVSDVAGIRALGLEPRAVAERAVDAWGEQVLRLGHFHGDPHPGNILVLPDGRLALIDFGLTARLTDEARAGVARLCHAAAERDFAGVVAAFESLGYYAEDGNPSAYLFLAQRVMGGAATADGSDDQVVESVSVRLARALRGFNIERVPPEALLMMRVLGLLAGLSARLGRPGPVLPAWSRHAASSQEARTGVG